MKRILLLFSMLLLPGLAAADHGMRQTSLERIVKTMATSSNGENGLVEFKFNEVRMFLISDVKHNRMRIVAPVADYLKLTREQLDLIMQSNYHKALDARYAMSENLLYSAFIHPLAELNEAQVRSAVQQVANLALSFGTAYSSGGLSFGSEY